MEKQILRVELISAWQEARRAVNILGKALQNTQDPNVGEWTINQQIANASYEAGASSARLDKLIAEILRTEIENEQLVK